jgi:hypothetical protein
MKELIFATSENPEVEIWANNRLFIKGWDQPQVQVRSQDENVELTGEATRVEVRCDQGCELYVPHSAALFIREAHGEVTIKGVQGDVELDAVGSGLSIKDVGRVQADQVGQDLNARGVSGSLSIRQVGRFANVKDVAGDITLESIGSHLNLKRATGNIEAHASGNVNLGLNPVEGQRCTVRAAGVLTCRIPAAANAVVSLGSHGLIKVRVGDLNETTTDGTFTATLGDGSAELDLFANGPATISELSEEEEGMGLDFDLNMGAEFGEDMARFSEDLASEISEQFSAQMEMIGQQIEATMAGYTSTYALDEEKAEKIRQRTQEKIARAQEKIRRAQERAARKIARAQRRAEKRERRVRTSEPRQRSGAWKPEADADPVSDEERMMILNMLSENKITLQEAEALLSALEGK